MRPNAQSKTTRTMQVQRRATVMSSKTNHAVQLDELGVVARRARQGASSLLSIGLARHCHGGGYRRVADRVGAIGGSVADAPELIRAFTDTGFFCQLIAIGYRQSHTRVGDISVGPFIKKIISVPGSSLPTKVRRRCSAYRSVSNTSSASS